MSTRTITRRDFVRTAGGGLVAPLGLQMGTLGCGKAAAPNILFIMSDQQHWRAVGYRDRFFDTPHQDALAQDSFVFDNFFCTTPQCSPSRSSIFTGWYPSTTGVMGNVGAAGGDNLEMETFGPRLQAGGYYTGYFGKWHLGDDAAANAGWDEESRRTKDVETTPKAVDFIRQHAGAEKPFALIASYLDPHDIYRFRQDMKDISGVSVQLPVSWSKETFDGKPPIHKQFMTEDQGTIIWGQEQKVWEYYHDYYRGKVRLYDNAVGELLQALKDSGAWENTIIIVTSDHGDMDTNHRLIFKGPFMYEHMVRIPLLIRVPSGCGGAAPRQVTDYQGVNADLAPTVLDLAGLTPHQCHGQSLKPMLMGTGELRQRDYVVSEYYSKQKWVNPIRMIRTPEFKYNPYILHGEEFYDLKNDPDELVNLAGDSAYAGKKKELKAALDKWIADSDDPFYSLHSTTREGERLPG